MTARLCSEPGCERAAIARGVCGMHYKRMRRAGVPALRRKGRGVCTLDGCDRVLNSRGLCALHAWRAREGHDLTAPILARRKSTATLIEDAEWLAGTDSPESIAARLGYSSWGNLAGVLGRKGRPDLVAAIVARRELPKSYWRVAS